MEFNYYYGSQADQFSFIRIPKGMLTEETFSSLSIPAKVLYGVLLDRMTLSRKNGWFDDENRVFIIYQIGEIQEDLGFPKKKAMELLAELEKFGLSVMVEENRIIIPDHPLKKPTENLSKIRSSKQQCKKACRNQQKNHY